VPRRADGATGATGAVPRVLMLLMMLRVRVLRVLTLVLLVAAPAAASERYALIVSGANGEISDPIPHAVNDLGDERLHCVRTHSQRCRT